MKEKLINYQKELDKNSLYMRIKKLFITSLILCISFGIKAFAQPTVDGTYYDWTVYELDEPGQGKLCYIASFPKKSIGNHTAKRDPYILITRFKNQRVEEVSIYSGYEYKLNSNIFVSIDGKQYRMFTKGDMAWAKTQEQDKEMIQRMLAGQELKTRGESSKGTYSVETYSLKGVTRAYKRMRDLCSSD